MATTRQAVERREALGRLDAQAKARGRATYVADISLPGMAYAAVARSTLSHAKIRSVDLSGALAAPGVIGAFTAESVNPAAYGRGLRDVPILARGKVRFIGEKVAAVVAESRVQAEAAAVLIDVDYEPLEAVTTVESALEAGAPVVHERAWEYVGAATTRGEHPNLVYHGTTGDREAVEAALAEAAFVVDEEYRLSSVHQAYLEPQACIAWWDEDRLRIWLTNKSPYALRGQLAACLGIDPEVIDVQPIFLGGDFGGKGSPEDAPLASELSRLTGRPVKIVLRYNEELIATNPRSSARIRIRVGCDTEGSLVAIHHDCFFNAGAYGGFTPRAAGPVGSHVASYRVPLASSETKRVYTNTVPRGNMRMPGGPQGCFALESILDELAQRAGLDPAELRRRNLLEDGEAAPHHRPWVEHRGRLTLEAALSAYEPIAPHPGWLHGRGIGIFCHATTSVASTSLRIAPSADGCLCVDVPITETGTGSHSVVRHLLAQALGIDPAKIEVRQVGSDDLPWDAGAGGSRVTASLAYLIEAATKAWEGRVGNEPITVRIDETGGGPDVGSYCAQIAQVAVDPETGETRVLEILTAVDVAEIVNPKAHQMQIDGGAITGFGYACLEDLDEHDGQVWAASLGEYKLATPSDTPRLRTVLVTGAKGVGISNVKMIGELTNSSVAPAVANAVFAATGCRLRELPITAERVYEALKGR